MSETIKPGLYRYNGDLRSAADLVYMLWRPPNNYNAKTEGPNRIRILEEIPRMVDNAGEKIDLFRYLNPLS